MRSRFREIGAGLVCLVFLQARFACARDPMRDAPVAAFRLTDWSGELGFWIDYVSEVQKHSEADTVRLSNLSFEEYLEYQIRGYLYHPRFFEFRAQVRLGMLQQQIEQSPPLLDSSPGGSSNTFLDGYDVYMTFLKEHPVSVSLYANHNRDAVRELFTDRLLLETENYGGVVNWKKGPVPMDIAFRESRMKETGFSSSSETHSRLFEYRARNNWADRIRTSLQYRFQNYLQTYRLQTDRIDLNRLTEIESHDVSLDNTVKFNREGTIYLQSLARLYSQSGSQTFQNEYWQERLNWRLAPNLNTYALFSAMRNELEDAAVTSKRAEAGLDHRLYQSLESHFDVHWRQSDFVEATDEETGATGRLGYRKQTPWGILSTGYSRTVNQVQRTGESQNRTIVDEQVAMRDGVTQFLSNPNVVSGSLVVTDQAGLVTYVQDFDYEVEVRGNQTGLRLMAGGLLSDGDVVLVDYRVEFTNDIQYVTDDQAFDIRYDFQKCLEGLSVYYRWHDLNASGGFNTDDLSVLIYTDSLLGARYDWRFLTWTEEYETYRSNFSSYNQIRSELEGHLRLRSSLNWGWHLGLLNLDYVDDGRQTDDENRFSDVVYARTTLRGNLTNRGFWELEAGARRETGLVDETLLGLLGRMQWRWRKIRLEAGGRVEQRDQFDSERDRVHLFLQVARELGASR